jgi:hypothetical protein
VQGQYLSLATPLFGAVENRNHAIPRVANPRQHEKKKKKHQKVLTRFCQ